MSGLFSNELDDSLASTVGEPKKSPRAIANRIRCPWHDAPAHTQPERLQVAEDLEEAFANKAMDWEEVSRFLVVACYCLSGSELEEIVRLVQSLLGNPCAVGNNCNNGEQCAR